MPMKVLKEVEEQGYPCVFERETEKKSERVSKRVILYCAIIQVYMYLVD